MDRMRKTVAFGLLAFGYGLNEESMRIPDLAMIVLYAVAMLAIGRYYRHRVKSSDDYLLGGRTMSPLMVGVSLFATLTSTLSYLAVPGEMIKNGPMIIAQLLSFPLVAWIVGWCLIPRIMREDVTSGYELLEKRLGPSGECWVPACSWPCASSGCQPSCTRLPAKC